MMNKSKTIITLSITLFGLSFLIGFLGLVRTPDVRIEWNKPDSTKNNLYNPRYGKQNMNEVALIYIGSSTCGFCNDEELPKILDEMKVKVRSFADSLGFGFKSIGISKDFRVNQGIQHLQKLGPFDEITTGNNWSNMGILKYIWDDLPGMPSTPQIVITKRIFNEYKFNPDSPSYAGLNKENVILRKSGLNNIKKWYETKFPISLIGVEF